MPAPRSVHRFRPLALVVFAGALTLSACGDDVDTEAVAPTAAESAPADAAPAAPAAESAPAAAESAPAADSAPAAESAPTGSAPEPAIAADASGSTMHGDAVVAAAPMSVRLRADIDPVRGVNLHLDTTGFTWAPESVNGANVDGAGHAHISVDGKAMGRLYGPDAHLVLMPGEHTIAVELNANDHRPYESGGTPVRSEATVTVPAAGAKHSHAHDPHQLAGASVGVRAEVDPKRGVNVTIDPVGVTLRPDRVNADHADGEGHAHVSVDGTFVMRAYVRHLHLLLEPGEHTIEVALTGNDHVPYVSGATPVVATATVTVP